MTIYYLHFVAKIICKSCECILCSLRGHVEFYSKVFSLPTKTYIKIKYTIEIISFEMFRLAMIDSLVYLSLQSIKCIFVWTNEKYLLCQIEFTTFLLELYLSSNRSEPKYIQ